MRDDKLVVNGVELTMDSTLATLRAGLTFYNLSTSGSKQKCFTRLANYQKQELEIITAAANQAQREDVREPQAPKLAVPPSEKEQQQHALTHLPFADWCPSVKTDTWWMEVQGVQVCLQFHLIFVTLEQFLMELTLLVPSLLQHW